MVSSRFLISISKACEHVFILSLYLCMHAIMFLTLFLNCRWREGKQREKIIRCGLYPTWMASQTYTDILIFSLYLMWICPFATVRSYEDKVRIRFVFFLSLFSGQWSDYTSGQREDLGGMTPLLDNGEYVMAYRIRYVWYLFSPVAMHGHLC